MLTLESGDYILKCDEAGATFSMSAVEGGAVVFSGAAGSVYLKADKTTLKTTGGDERRVSRTDDAIRVETVFNKTGMTLVHEARAIDCGDGFIFTIKLLNNGAFRVKGVDYYPFELDRMGGGFLFSDGDSHDFRFLRNGMLTWSDCRVYRMDERMYGSAIKVVHDAAENPEVRRPGGRGHFIGEWFGVVRDNVNGNILAAGFTPCDRQLGQVSFKSSKGFFRNLKAVSRGESAVVEPGGEGSSLNFAVMADVSEIAAAPLGFDRLIQKFFTFAAEQLPPPHMPENPVGWCSWYYYFHDMSEKVITDNLAAMEDMKDEIPITLVQVDDGYQPALGDWLETTPKFKRGMKWMAERIAGHGFTPGIWLAPFLITDRSSIYKEHKDWLVQDENGKPRFITFWTSPFAPGRCFGLDTTHPEARDWLRETFSAIVRDWGYPYLKLDFLYAGAIDGKRYDETATRAEALRSGLQLIRDTVGDDIYMLGCGIPLSVGQGIVNGARVSGDTAPMWHDAFISGALGHRAAPGVKNASRVLLARYFMHRKFWLSDPDCVMTRFTNTKLNGAEVLTHATCVAMMGGPLFLSDNMMKIGTESVRLAQQIIPPVDTPAIPAGLFDFEMSPLLVMPFEREFDPLTVAALINWEDDAEDMHLNFEQAGLDPERKYHVYELWEDRYYGVYQGHVIFPGVAPHETRLVSVRPVVDRPQLIATTFHFTQGGVDVTACSYDENKKALEMVIDIPGDREGRAYFYVPKGYACDRVVVNSTHETILNREGAEFFSLELNVNGRTDVVIEFRTKG